MSRLVRNAAVKRVLEASLLVEVGGSVAFQATAHKHFVEAVEPPQAARFHQRYVFWICTGPCTGDRQPISSAPAHAFQMLIPRVGRISKENEPLFTRTTSTPSLGPPLSVFFVTDQPLDAPARDIHRPYFQFIHINAGIAIGKREGFGGHNGACAPELQDVENSNLADGGTNRDKVRCGFRVVNRLLASSA